MKRSPANRAGLLRGIKVLVAIITMFHISFSPKLPVYRAVPADSISDKAIWQKNNVTSNRPLGCCFFYTSLIRVLWYNETQHTGICRNTLLGIRYV